MTALSLTDVVADYGELRVLGPLSLDVVRGQTVALVGKSGAGKSTLLSLMYHQWRPLGAALMPQDLGLVPALSTYHNVYMGGLARHSTGHNLLSLVRPFKRDIAEILPILQALDIDHKCWTSAEALSGGQRQRVAAARVIHQKGEVLLADEPASALDGPMAERVMTALTSAYATSVLAMHDVELALRFADRVVGIADGQIALDEPRARVQAHDLLALY